MELNKTHHKNCIIGMKDLPDNCIDCCITSPPYFGLRDYGTATWEGGDKHCKHSYIVNSPYNENFNERYGNASGLKKQESQRHELLYKESCKDCGAIRNDEQIGLEKTPELYVKNIVEVFIEVKRVLKKEGTLWLNLGDSYVANGQGKSHSNSFGKERTNLTGESGGVINQPNARARLYGYKPKDLIGIPWLVAFALRNSGWYLRQDIIWAKPNPMPESVTDRCTKSHEYIFLLSKSAKYYYDAEAIKTKMTESSIERLNQNLELQIGSDRVPGKTNGNMKAVGRPNGIVRDRLLDYDSKEKELRPNTIRGGYENENDLPGPDGLANKRSVWTVNTMPYREAHFATFPEKLVVDMIKAGCPEGGIVLDPFAGANTTGLVARKLNRNFICYELNENYIKIGNERLQKELGLFI